MESRNESVWFEEVDTALIQYISGIVKVPDIDHTLVPVPVKVRKPDEDFKIEEYPLVTLYNLNSMLDAVRYYPDPVLIRRKDGTAVKENPAVPYVLNYQIDFWATKIVHLNEMTRRWAVSHPDRSFNLPVVDMSGNNRDCFVMLANDIIRTDFVDGVKRLFHVSFTCKIQVELDEGVQESVDIIKEVPPPIDCRECFDENHRTCK